MTSSYNSKLSNVAYEYLKLLKIPVTKKGINSLLNQHYHYPSLLSITDILNKYKVSNAAYHLEERHIDELVAPFITICTNLPTGKDFVLVTEITPTTITYKTDYTKEKTCLRSEFLLDWKNAVLIAKKENDSIEPQYLENTKLEKRESQRAKLLKFTFASFLILATFSFFFNLDRTQLFYASPILVTKLIGSTIAIILLIYEIDKSNSFIKDLCTGGKQTNCDAVLTSKAAGFAGVKWSEAGFFYFASTLLFLLYPGISFTSKIPLLAITAIIVSPYMVFSIYYQYKIVKEWCKLCLATQGVLLLEAIWGILSIPKNTFSNPQIFSSEIVITLVLSILTPIIVWYFLKPVFQKANDSEIYNNAFKRLLYNPENFSQLLQTQKKVADGWENIGITLGNENAKNTIIKVCNPYCGPCARAHPKLEELIKQNNDFKLKIIFNNTNHVNDIGNKPIRHLLSISSENNLLRTQKAVDDWYDPQKKDYDLFAVKYPKDESELQLQNTKIDEMRNWCINTGITFTPTIFINGNQLPDNYSIDELINIF
jgi:uncharacterized membrane protein